MYKRQSPYFVYDTVFSDGFNWNTITDKGQFVPNSAAVSLKAAMGMWVLWNSPYTDRLLDAIENANEAGKGYYEGLYENGDGPINEFTVNNNGIMLEALLFKKEGKLLQFSSDNPKNRDFAPSLWDKKLVDLFEPNNGPRNRPFLSNTPAVKTWCEQTGTTQRTQPACQACLRGSGLFAPCLLYTSDAADDLLCVDLGGRRIIKQKKQKKKTIWSPFIRTT